jgi:hypothetical protein
VALHGDLRAPLSFSDAIDPLSPGHVDCANVSAAERLRKDVRQFTNAVVLCVFALPRFPKTFSIDCETWDDNPPCSVRVWILNDENPPVFAFVC